MSRATSIPQINQLIEKFVRSIMERYPGVHIEQEFDPDVNAIFLWHNYKDFSNPVFAELRANLTESIFEDNGIYNVCFTYGVHLSAKRSKTI